MSMPTKVVAGSRQTDRHRKNCSIGMWGISQRADHTVISLSIREAVSSTKCNWE